MGARHGRQEVEDGIMKFHAHRRTSLGWAFSILVYSGNVSFIFGPYFAMLSWGK